MAVSRQESSSTSGGQGGSRTKSVVQRLQVGDVAIYYCCSGEHSLFYVGACYVQAVNEAQGICQGEVVPSHVLLGG